MLTIVCLVLAIMYLAEFNVGTALAICTIVKALCEVFVAIIKIIRND